MPFRRDRSQNQPKRYDQQTYLIVIATTGDLASRLRAGEAASAVLLTATTLGPATCPLSQPMEISATCRLIRDDVLSGTGEPQLLLRISQPSPGARGTTSNPAPPHRRRTRPDTKLSGTPPRAPHQAPRLTQRRPHHLSLFWTVGKGALAIGSHSPHPGGDLCRPGLSGIGVLRHIRTGERTRTMRIVLITAWPSDTDVQAGRTAGPDDYLIKPFRPQLTRAPRQQLASRVKCVTAPADARICSAFTPPWAARIVIVVQLPNQPVDDAIERLPRASRARAGLDRTAVDIERHVNSHRPATGLGPAEPDMKSQHWFVRVTQNTHHLTGHKLLDAEAELASNGDPRCGQRGRSRSHTSMFPELDPAARRLRSFPDRVQSPCLALRGRPADRSTGRSGALSTRL